MWEFVLSLVVVVVVSYIYTWLNDRKRRRPPLAPGLPLLGNVLQLKPDGIHQGLSRLTEKNGNIFRIRMFGSEAVVVSSADLIYEASVTKGDDFAGRSRAPYAIAAVTYNANDLGFLPYGKTWSMLRKAVHASIKTYGEGSREVEELIQNELEEVVQTYDRTGGAPVNPQPELRHALINIIACLIIGRGVEKNSKEAKDIAEMAEGLLSCMTPGFGAELDLFPFLRWLPIRSVKYIRRIQEVRDAVLDPVYKESKMRFDKEDVRTFVDAMLQGSRRGLKPNGKPLITDESILGSMLDLFSAGVFTTFSTVSSLMLISLHYPKIQKKLQKEIDTVTGRSQMPSLHHRTDMHYLNAVFYEIQRYVSVAALVPRAATRDATLGGYDIDKGTPVIINLWGAHHNKDWEEPWKFIPERFLDKEGKLLPATHPRRAKLMAFGGGPRSCVGEAFAKNRVFLFIATLWQKFSFLPVEGQELPSCDPRDFELTAAVCPKGFTCRIVSRN